MAWATPRDWTTGEVVTAAIMNTHVRDELKWLGGSDGRGTTLPSSPVDGQLFVYVADATNGIEWLLKYNSGETGSYKWRYIGGPPLYSEVTAFETLSNNGTYTDLATVGPQLTVPLAGDYLVRHGMYAVAGENGYNSFGYMSYQIGGTAASDADAIIARTDNAGANKAYASHSRLRRKNGLAAGTTITAKYRTSTGTPAPSISAGNRYLEIKPVRVG